MEYMVAFEELASTRVVELPVHKLSDAVKLFKVLKHLDWPVRLYDKYPSSDEWNVLMQSWHYND